MNWVVTFTTPIFLAHSSYGVYFLFGGACLLTVLVCVFFMPETRGKTLEDIDASIRRKSSNALERDAEIHIIPLGSSKVFSSSSSVV